MKSYARYFRTALVCSALFAPVTANSVNAQQAIDVRLRTVFTERALLTAIVSWLSGNFDLPLPADYPRLAPGEKPRGYDSGGKTIYVSNEWTGGSPAELSILVREMAHHLQNLAGRNYGCPEERQAVPCAAQEKWLRLSGRDLMTEFGISPDVLLMSTQCVP
jgi:uncharacterized protein DUF6647